MSRMDSLPLELLINILARAPRLCVVATWSNVFEGHGIRWLRRVALVAVDYRPMTPARWPDLMHRLTRAASVETADMPNFLATISTVITAYPQFKADRLFYEELDDGRVSVSYQGVMKKALDKCLSENLVEGSSVTLQVMCQRPPGVDDKTYFVTRFGSSLRYKWHIVHEEALDGTTRPDVIWFTDAVEEEQVVQENWNSEWVWCVTVTLKMANSTSEHVLMESFVEAAQNGAQEAI